MPVLFDQVDRPAVAHHRLHEARPVLIRAIALEVRLRADHTQEHRQVAAGRIAVGADAVGVEVVVPGVGAQPSDGVLGRRNGIITVGLPSRMVSRAFSNCAGSASSKHKS